MRTNEATLFLSVFFLGGGGKFYFCFTVEHLLEIVFIRYSQNIRYDQMGNAMGGEYVVADVVENILGLKYNYIYRKVNFRYT